MSAVEFPSEPSHVIFAAHPVRRVAWRPNHDTEIAVVSTQAGISDIAQPADRNHEPGPTDSSEEPAMEAESRLEVWDVRRSYVAKYILGLATRFVAAGAATDIAWADGSQGQALQACYSVGAFVQFDMRHHHRPLDIVPRQAMSWGGPGELAVATDRWVVGEIPFDDM
jgi:hypothetical protein